MKETTCIITLGSNTEGDKYFDLAHRELLRYFPDMTYATPCHTQPVGMTNPFLFLNQVALFHTTLPLREVKDLLKKIESRCADTPKDKALGIIRIDIDLLQYGAEVLKWEDMNRPYVKEGMKVLLSN